MFVIRSLMVVTALSAASACSRMHIDPTVDPEVTMVSIDNATFVDSDVYVMDGASAVRLGRVVGRTSREFPVPGDMLAAQSSLQLFVRPQRGISYRMPTLQVGTGQRVSVVLAPDPAYASINVLPPRRR